MNLRTRSAAAIAKRQDVRAENRRMAWGLVAVMVALVIYSVIVIIVKHS